MASSRVVRGSALIIAVAGLTLALLSAADAFFFLLNTLVAALVVFGAVCCAIASQFKRSWVTLFQDIVPAYCLALMLIGIVQFVSNLPNLDDAGIVVFPVFSVAWLLPFYGLLAVGVTRPWVPSSVELPSSKLSAAFGVLLLWLAILFAVLSRVGADVFLHQSALLCTLGGVVFFLAIDVFRGQTDPGGWRDRLLGLGTAGFFGGTLVAFVQADSLSEMVAGMIWALNSMLYALVLLLTARFLFPHAVISSGRQEMGLGFLSLTAPVWLGSFLHLYILQVFFSA